MSFESFYAKIKSDIETVGQSVVGIGDLPTFSYTIGNAVKGLPELLMIGLHPFNATPILNILGERQRAGETCGNG